MTEVFFDLESLIHVEQTFYDSGYQDGLAHGRIHGLMEGRALGREQGFEMWEEIGFYEGFALTWKAILSRQSKKDDRCSQHIRHLLEYISQFPRVNPSISDDDAVSSLDISRLLRQIRSRYKALCSILGVHPRLFQSSSQVPADEEIQDMQIDEPSSKVAVWKLDKTGAKKPVTNQDLSF